MMAHLLYVAGTLMIAWPLYSGLSLIACLHLEAYCERIRARSSGAWKARARLGRTRTFIWHSAPIGHCPSCLLPFVGGETAVAVKVCDCR